MAELIRCEGRLADQDGAATQQRDDERCQFESERTARREISGPGVEMGERYMARDRLAGAPQSVAHVAEKEVFSGRHAIGMRGEPTLAHVDFSIREKLTKMIVGPSVAEPKL